MMTTFLLSHFDVIFRCSAYIVLQLDFHFTCSLSIGGDVYKSRKISLISSVVPEEEQEGFYSVCEYILYCMSS